MFKKLILSILAVGSSYAIEPSKDVVNKDINSITQQMNNTTLNNVQNNTSNINNPQTSVAQPPLFDIKKLVTTKHFKDMTNDEKDWARLNAYDQFSKKCQKFWQTVIAEKKITDISKGQLYFNQAFQICVITGIDPASVLFDELKYNIGKSCLVDSKLYLSDDQLSALKAQVTQCVSIMQRHFRGFDRVQERFNIQDRNLAEIIYWYNYYTQKGDIATFYRTIDLSAFRKKARSEEAIV